jgi:hypothetical protein
MHLATALIPDPAIGARLINPAGFDKKMAHPFSGH